MCRCVKNKVGKETENKGKCESVYIETLEKEFEKGWNIFEYRGDEGDLEGVMIVNKKCPLYKENK